MGIIEIVGLPDLQRTLTAMEERVFPRAAARAVNSTARTLRSDTVKAVAKRMGIKQKDVRGRTHIQRAKPGLSPRAVVTIRGRALNLIRFRARQTKKGVTAAPWGTRRLFRHAFIARTIPGSPVMTRRKYGAVRVGRMPIRGMLGPGIAKTANEPDLVRERASTLRRVLPERLARDIAYLVSKLP